MPIYAYRCADCGFEKDYLQKMSDPVLTECPQCSKTTFTKQLTAAGFQLKGSGWYATDFKGGAKPNDSDKASADNDKAAADGVAKDGVAKDGAPKDGAPKDGAAKEATPAKEIPTKETAPASTST